MRNCPTRRSDYRIWRECHRGMASPRCSVEQPVISLPTITNREKMCNPPRDARIAKGCNFVAAFYVHDQTMLDALSSLALTLLALCLLVVMMAIFQRDAKNMSRQINQ